MDDYYLTDNKNTFVKVKKLSWKIRQNKWYVFIDAGPLGQVEPKGQLNSEWIY